MTRECGNDRRECGKIIPMNSPLDDFRALLLALIWYSRKKLKFFAKRFENYKNLVVEILMQKRGALQKSFWHGSMIGLASVGILTSGIFGGGSLISSTYPGIGGPDPRFTDAFEPFPNGVLFNPQSITGLGTHTEVSVKPRSGSID